MGVVLGPNQYGKAETRVVRVYRDTERHTIRDVNVSTTLRGDFADAHVTGDQSGVLPTDSQKNTVFSFAKETGIGAVEDFAVGLARHFVATTATVHSARVEVQEYTWDRIAVDGAGHDHSFQRGGQEVRTATAVVSDDADDTDEADAAGGDDLSTAVVSGIRDLVVLKSTGSQFTGFHTDRYTTLAEAEDRVLATSLVARWRYRGDPVDWDATYSSVRETMLKTFATVHSHALQHSLYVMGRAVLDVHPAVAEVRFSAPNKHHILVDLSPFGVDNPGEVFYATDRPYGLIEATVTRDDVPGAGDQSLTPW